MSIERHYSESHAARLAAREKQSQQNFRPVISLHKWFARRPGTLFRALALAEFLQAPTAATLQEGHRLEGVVLDPFMGGGTTLIEASRLGLAVIGYDTKPIARWVVEREVETLDPDALAQAGERVIAQVQGDVKALYETECAGCGRTVSAYFIWVRQHRCVCGIEHPLLAEVAPVAVELR